MCLRAAALSADWDLMTGFLCAVCLLPVHNLQTREEEEEEVTKGRGQGRADLSSDVVTTER